MSKPHIDSEKHHAAQAELEELVASRTRELHEANIQLQAQMAEQKRLEEALHNKEIEFREGQGRILEMIAANVPLAEVLANPIPFPKLTKVEMQNDSNPEPTQTAEAGRTHEAKAG